MAEIERLEHWLAPLLAQLQPQQLRQLTREIARDLRQDNARNISAQRGTDGQAWDKRKQQRKAAKPIRYLYKARDGHVRELEMSSYRREGGRIIGYDKEAGSIRTMVGERIIKKMVPKRGGSASAQLKKAQLMMQGLRSSRYLHAKATDAQAVVEFAGRVQRIARVHHYGLRDRVKPGGPDYDYPERPLLGIPAEFEERLKDRVIAHLAGGR